MSIITLEAIEEGLGNLADTTDTIIGILPRTTKQQPEQPKQPQQPQQKPHSSTSPSTTAEHCGLSRSVQEMAQKYAPPGLEKPFEQLYRALSPCLLPNQNHHHNTNENNNSINSNNNNNTNNQIKPPTKKNASVFIQGPRGCGKTVLVKSCLQAIVDEQHQQQHHHESTTGTPAFRPVYLTSMLHVPTQKNHPNAGAAAVVDEILRQLVSNSSSTCGSDGPPNSNNNTNKRQKTELLRLRQTSFTNHLQLLTEILQIAAVDGIPILFILDNVPQFPPLILYHLLDRIAGSAGNGGGSNGGNGGEGHYLALIGMTTHALTCLKTSGFVEKRIVSRVEGTSSLIHLPACVPTAVLPIMLQRKLPTNLHPLVQQVFVPDQQNNNSNRIEATTDPPSSSSSSSSSSSYVLEALQRQERLGKSTRWFCRVFALALACLREDLVRRQASSSPSTTPSSSTTSASSQQQSVNFCDYVREALEDFGVNVLVDSSSTTSHRLSKTSLSVLQDLSTPQLLLVLAARRILARSNHHHKEGGGGGDGLVVLTLEGMLQEVIQKLYRGNPPHNTASPAVLKRAFLDLMDLAVLRPAVDHSGTGPWQYYEKAAETSTTTTSTSAQQEALFGWDIRMRMPLHLTLDIHRDVLPALELKAVTASASILEWGKKLN